MGRPGVGGSPRSARPAGATRPDRRAARTRPGRRPGRASRSRASRGWRAAGTRRSGRAGRGQRGRCLPRPRLPRDHRHLAQCQLQPMPKRDLAVRKAPGVHGAADPGLRRARRRDLETRPDHPGLRHLDGDGLGVSDVDGRCAVVPRVRSPLLSEVPRQWASAPSRVRGPPPSFIETARSPPYDGHRRNSRDLCVLVCVFAPHAGADRHGGTPCLRIAGLQKVLWTLCRTCQLDK